MAFEKLLTRFPNATMDSAGVVTIPALGAGYPSKIALRIAASAKNQAGKVYEKVNPFPKPTAPTTPSTGSKVTITATFSQAPATPTLAYTLLKYGKEVGIEIQSDDGGWVDYHTIWPVVQAVTGLTDGASNSVLPGWTFPLTAYENGLPNRDNATSSTITTWAEYRLMKPYRNIGFANHSSQHSPTNPAGQIDENDAILLDKLGVIPRTLVVPGGFNGFVGAFFDPSRPKNLRATSQGWGQDGSNAVAAPYGSEATYGEQVVVPVSNPNRMLYNRWFVENQDWGQPMRDWISGKLTAAAGLVSQNKRAIISIGDHFKADQGPNLAAFFEYVKQHPNGGDRVWWCNMQEQAEYEEVKAKCPISAPVVSGNTVTWTIDRAALPAYSLYQDASLRVSGGTLVSVTVTGGDSFSVNTSTGLVNVFKLNTVVAAVPTTPSTPTTPTTPSTPTTPVATLPQTPGVDGEPAFALWDASPKTTGEVPLDPKYIFWSNNYHDVPFTALRDGSTAPYYGGAFKYQDAYSQANSRVVATTRPYRTDLTHIRVVYRQATENPIVVKYIPKGSFDEVLLGEVPNQLGPTWIQLDFPQKTAVTSLVFYSKNGSDQFSELKLFGDFVEPVPVVSSIVTAPTRELMTTNFFKWNYLQSDSPANIEAAKAEQMTAFNGGRLYEDQVHIQPVEDRIMIGPSSNDYGSWNLDNLWQYLKDNKKDFRLNIKNQSPFLINTYPEEYRTSEQKPVKWQGSIEATIAYAKTAAAYLNKAKLWWQVVARAGSKVWPDELLNVYQPAGKPFGYNEKRSGLNTVKRVEPENENESWWRGLMGSMTPAEMERLDSACYDGDMGRLGPYTGVKQADPSVDYSTGGKAIATIETMHGYVESARKNRGYRANGTVNVPFDKYNYHFYANDGGSLQIGDITRGMAPELAGFHLKLREIKAFCKEWLNDIPVIIGEWGYDVSEFSSQAAVRPIDLLRDGNGSVVKDQYGNRQVKQGGDRTQRLLTQGDWYLRTVELCAIEGADELAWYMKDDASYPASEYSRYSACGAFNFDGTWRPMAFYSYQVLNLTGNYRVTSAQVSDKLYVSNKTEEGTGKTCQAVWVPDEVAREEDWDVTLTAPAVVCYPVSNSKLMRKVALGIGTHRLRATETPFYLMHNQTL